MRKKVARTAFDSFSVIGWDDALNGIQQENWLKMADRILAIPEIAEALNDNNTAYENGWSAGYSARDAEG